MAPAWSCLKQLFTKLLHREIKFAKLVGKPSGWSPVLASLPASRPQNLSAVNEFSPLEQLREVQWRCSQLTTLCWRRVHRCNISKTTQTSQISPTWTCIPSIWKNSNAIWPDTRKPKQWCCSCFTRQFSCWPSLEMWWSWLWFCPTDTCEMSLTSSWSTWLLLTWQVSFASCAYCTSHLLGGFQLWTLLVSGSSDTWRWSCLRNHLFISSFELLFSVCRRVVCTTVQDDCFWPQISSSLVASWCTSKKSFPSSQWKHKTVNRLAHAGKLCDCPERQQGHDCFISVSMKCLSRTNAFHKFFLKEQKLQQSSKSRLARHGTAANEVALINPHFRKTHCDAGKASTKRTWCSFLH